MYKIEYSKEVEKDLSKLPKTEIRRVLTKVEKLAKNPRPSGLEPLQGKLKGLHRIRSGKYRVIYEIVDKRLTVLVVRISHRQKVYRK